jgi:hypothetical protein
VSEPIFYILLNFNYPFNVAVESHNLLMTVLFILSDEHLSRRCTKPYVLKAAIQYVLEFNVICKSAFESCCSFGDALLDGEQLTSEGEVLIHLYTFRPPLYCYNLKSTYSIYTEKHFKEKEANIIYRHRLRVLVQH